MTATTPTTTATSVRGLGLNRTRALEDTATAEERVRQSIGSVDDPEYPGISIVELGLLETVEISDDGREITVGLIPTFSGCPALAVIADDVRTAVQRDFAGAMVTVHWLRAPAWTTDRVSTAARATMADRFTVAVRIGATEPTCPLCGGPVEQRSLFGPSRCRAVYRCENCRETVEVMRG